MLARGTHWRRRDGGRIERWRALHPSSCSGMGIWYFFSSSFLASTHLLHDAGLSLGIGDVTTRLVADELDLDLAALASALLVVVVIVVGGARSLGLGSAIL